MHRHPASDAEAAGMDRDLRQRGMDRRQHPRCCSARVTPNLLGEAAVAMQAIAVGALAALQVSACAQRRCADGLSQSDCHCERSEAIQKATRKDWIASSLSLSSGPAKGRTRWLLAMTRSALTA